MEPLTLALWIVVATLAVLATGIPIAFGLALVSTVFFLAIEGFGRVPLLAEHFGMDYKILVSLPSQCFYLWV
jgi:C4-dicarboxylate transporter, DctM subunit